MLRVALVLCWSASACAGGLVVQRRFLSKGSLQLGREHLPVVIRNQSTPPTEFDARTKWPNCTSIGYIPDQGACGDCWAVSTVTAATDRMCISTGIGGPQQPVLSVEHMVGCCHVCGYGCGDGFPNYAWGWLAGQKGKPYGVVTGGGWQDTRWCSAYTVPPCNHFKSRNNTLPNCEGGPPAPTPTCPKACDANSTYAVQFADDVRQFKSAYAVATDETSIMNEILEHGPVTAGFNVYSDWIHYRSGVYKATGGDELGGHAVKIIGWGTEDSQPYWLVVNSFGVTWGDKGYFKIIRGAGSAGIDQNVVAGLYA